jgi:hypothetical protein
MEAKKSFRMNREHNKEKIDLEFKNLADYYNRYKKLESTWINEFSMVYKN